MYVVLKSKIQCFSTQRNQLQKYGAKSIFGFHASLQSLPYAAAAYHPSIKAMEAKRLSVKLNRILDDLDSFTVIINEDDYSTTSSTTSF